MLQNHQDITLEELYSKLLPTSFWDEVATRFPNIPAAKLYPFQDILAVSPYINRVNEHKKALLFFSRSLLDYLPQEAKTPYKDAIKSKIILHMERFLEPLALECQNNLRAYFHSQYAPSPVNKAMVVTPSTLNSFLGKSAVVLIDFWTEWCGPCKAFIPTVNKLIHLYGKKVAIGKVDLDKYPELARHYNVISIPTLLFFKNGYPEKRLVGIHAFEDIKVLIDHLLCE